MPDRLSYKITNDGLIPDGFDATAHHANLHIGDVVELHMYQRRNKTLGNALALLVIRLAEAKKWRVRTMRSALAIWTGRSDLIEIYPGRKIPIAWGTGPSEMSQIELEVFALDAANVIETELMPALAPDDAADVRELIVTVMRNS